MRGDATAGKSGPYYSVRAKGEIEEIMRALALRQA
jgi:hypothetical protein